MSQKIWILTPYILSPFSVDIKFDYDNQRIFNKFDTVKSIILTVADAKKSRNMPFMWAEIKEFCTDEYGELIINGFYSIGELQNGNVTLLSHPITTTS